MSVQEMHVFFPERSFNDFVYPQEFLEDILQTDQSTIPEFESSNPGRLRNAARSVIHRLKKIVFDWDPSLPDPETLPIEDLHGGGAMKPKDDLTDEEKAKLEEAFQDKIDLQDSISKTGSCVVYRNRMKKYCRILEISNESSFGGFFDYFSCYHLMPFSSKIIILDINLKVQVAYLSLVHNHARAAPVWDECRHRFVAMLTITDFIRFLHSFYQLHPNLLDKLPTYTIKEWLELLEQTSPRNSLIHVYPEHSLKEAADIIQSHNIHRLPVLDPNNGNVLNTVTNYQIFHFFYRKIMPACFTNPRFMHETPFTLGLGCYDDRIATVRPDQTVFEALTIFCNNNVSSLPVCDSDNRLIGYYSRHDVIILAENHYYKNLELTIDDAIKLRKNLKHPCTCMESDSLQHILDTIYKAEVHRIYVVDTDQHIQGVISLSDILEFLCRL